jgi:hypothetical protein
MIVFRIAATMGVQVGGVFVRIIFLHDRDSAGCRDNEMGSGSAAKVGALKSVLEFCMRAPFLPKDIE